MERMHREALNGRFLSLVWMLPPFAALRRPRKAAILGSSIATVHVARRPCVLAAQMLRALARTDKEGALSFDVTASCFLRFCLFVVSVFRSGILSYTFPSPLPNPPFLCSLWLLSLHFVRAAPTSARFPFLVIG
ncbi:hypothetical protein B0H19DRAFT_541625 [Mycena capillaripes]|nr:hypothetical protein B0H19DRAFT_541625 [Mycena capillaripes]